MAPASKPGSCSSLRDARFVTTQWSQVLEAGAAGGGQSQEALAALCRDYWPPLYSYARRKGLAREDAQDLVQTFFERLIRNEGLSGIQREGARFRSFLLAGLTRLLATEWRRLQAKKRGAGAVPMAFDAPELEERLSRLSENASAEEVYDREWALAILNHAASALNSEYKAEGKEHLFAALRPVVFGENTQSYAELAGELGATEGAVKTAVHRLRRRYGEQIRWEISRTLSSAEDLSDELRYLMKVLAR